MIGKTLLWQGRVEKVLFVLWKMSLLSVFPERSGLLKYVRSVRPDVCVVCVWNASRGGISLSALGKPTVCIWNTVWCVYVIFIVTAVKDLFRLLCVCLGILNWNNIVKNKGSSTPQRRNASLRRIASLITSKLFGFQCRHSLYIYNIGARRIFWRCGQIMDLETKVPQRRSPWRALVGV